MDDYEIDHEDVIIKLFVQLLRDDVKEWYSNFLPTPISSWNEFRLFFNEQFVERVFDFQSLIISWIFILGVEN